MPRTRLEDGGCGESGPEDIARFNVILRENGCSASTRAKHLRVLGACLQAAIYYRFADANPVRELPPAQRPRPERKEAACFENDELPRLFEHLRDEPYRSLCLTALKTGMRQGKLLALRWGDVDLKQAVVRVRYSFTGGQLGTPKNRERRDVDLISDVVTHLTRQRDHSEHGTADTLVFPNHNLGFLSNDPAQTEALPGDGRGEHPTRRANAGKANLR